MSCIGCFQDKMMAPTLSGLGLLPVGFGYLGDDAAPGDERAMVSQTQFTADTSSLELENSMFGAGAGTQPGAMSVATAPYAAPPMVATSQPTLFGRPPTPSAMGPGVQSSLLSNPAILIGGAVLIGGVVLFLALK